jgi:hypothetical protein
MTRGIGRVAVVRDQAARLPGRLSRAAADWIADRRLAPQERVVVAVGFAAEPATAEGMARAAEGVLDPVALRVQRWLDERTIPSPTGTRAAALHADFTAWCQRQGFRALGLAQFARRLHALGIEGQLHPRTRQSRFCLTLREGEAAP